MAKKIKGVVLRALGVQTKGYRTGPDWWYLYSQF